ncbi:MAG: class I SAM-dependent methyltransferase [Candidatus Aegiribacteria sp.]|nr:class I SAM-dependent methyltransferase [Candidatus Aegiribacteria sp.]
MNFLIQSFPEKSRMQKDCRSIKFDLNDKQAELLTEYAEILSERSLTTNLIGPKESYRLWERHILESISYIQLLDRSSKVVDIGSGAGFPGIVLGILGMDMILLEPRRKRNLFLSHVIERLALEKTEVIPLKIESVDPGILGDQFVARTVASPEVLLELIRRKKEGQSKLVYRVPPDIELTIGNKYIKLECPPLDRQGFLVQYRTCS